MRRRPRDAVHRLLIGVSWRVGDGLGRRRNGSKRKGGNKGEYGEGFHGHLLSWIENRRWRGLVAAVPPKQRQFRREDFWPMSRSVARRVRRAREHARRTQRAKRPRPNS